jgi:Cu+-exporting ATPase
MGKNLIELKVDGMDCNNCAISISRYLERKGLEDVFVNFQTKEVRFSPGTDTPDLNKIKAGIQKMGYTVMEEETVLP